MKRLAIIAALTLILGLCGCSPESGESHSIWSTYNTTKVIQQSERNSTYQQLEAGLSVQMMQGEYEGAQLIVTAGQDTAYNLTPGTLTSESGCTFPSENVQIYHQKYQTVSKNFNGDKAFQSGDAIPDMLLPLSIAEAYGENIIEKGCNQGITVEFFSGDVPAGTYTGSFTLDLDGQTREIPVSVEVWDFQYEGRRDFQSCFVLYRDELFISEFRCDDQLVDTYVETLLDYKINTYVIQQYTPELFVQETQRRFADNRYNAIAIPYRFPWVYSTYENGAVTEAAQGAIDYIKALAKASAPEHNYLAHAYLYLSFLDEADINGREQAAEAFLKDGGEYQQLLQLVISQLEEEGWFDTQDSQFAQEIKQNILQLPALFTNVNYIPQWVGTLNATFCPYLSVYQDTGILNRYQEAAAHRSAGKLWLYTCCGPVDPYPTFHIDDGTLDKRVCGWMMKAYDISGYLYYKVNNYAYLTSAPEDAYIDVYATPARYYDVNGDGFLLYPGRYYESDKPFGTVRLAAYRDGMDEYDMLCIYEDLLTQYAQEQGISDFDFSLYVEDLYRNLFDNMVSTQDAAALYAAREALAQRILALKKENRLIADPADRETVNLTRFDKGEQALEIKAQYRDKGEQIGTKTKMFLPSYTVDVSGLEGGKVLSFSYENTGNADIAMQIVLVTQSGKVTLDTSFCGAGNTRQVRIPLPYDLEGITQIQLVFDNVQVTPDGQTALYPDRSFTVSDFTVTK